MKKRRPTTKASKPSADILTKDADPHQVLECLDRLVIFFGRDRGRQLGCRISTELKYIQDNTRGIVSRNHAEINVPAWSKGQHEHWTVTDPTKRIERVYIALSKKKIGHVAWAFSNYEYRDASAGPGPEAGMDAAWAFVEGCTKDAVVRFLKGWMTRISEELDQDLSHSGGRPKLTPADFAPWEQEAFRERARRYGSKKIPHGGTGIIAGAISKTQPEVQRLFDKVHKQKPWAWTAFSPAK